MKVWISYYYHGDDMVITGVFSKKEKAEARMERDCPHGEPEEFELDAPEAGESSNQDRRRK